MRAVILHGHIFKNAGTTLDWTLRRQFGKGFLDHRDDRAMRAGEGEHIRELVESQPGLRAISSHHMTGEVPAMPDVDFLRVFFLRHPIERMRSVYDFELRQRGQTPGSRAARSKSFKQYVAWRMEPDVAHTIRNYQTLYLAGFHGRATDAGIAHIHLPAALKVLRGSSIIGLVDRYDESMVLIEEALRPYYPDIDLASVPQNVGQKNGARSSAEARVASVLGDLEELQKLVIDKNSYDLALYQLAGQLLEGKINKLPDFEAKLADYRARCKRLSGRKLARFF